LLRRVMGELLGCEDWLQRDAAHRAEVLAHLLATDGLPEPSASRPLSDEAAEALAVFRAISTARQLYGGAAIGLFIISMAQGADDVLTALALAEIANPHTGASTQLDVAPLLETVDDLQAGPDIVRSLLALRPYRKHLKGLGNRQVVMVGYSDSNKDSGIVASRWALYEAQRRLVGVGADEDVDIVFFHGRGGTVSRGGGNLVNGILGAPPGSVGGFLRLTEQGEVINQKYGVRFLALRNLELVAGATLTHTVSRSRGLEEEESAILAGMAGRARSRFRGLVYDDPGFAPWFRLATPIEVIERLNIGSRPASRRSGEGIENLRAIPWVFSWAQVRIGFPGVFGFGTALDAAIEEYGLETIRNLLNKNIFFQAMVNDVEMVLGKSELGIGRRYAGLAGTEGLHYFATISAEFDLAAGRILELKRLDRLLDDQRVLQRNIRLRNPYVDPLHLLQIDLLRRWRIGGRQDDHLLEALKATVKGIALGIQNTG
jgi:phosphoenolpyruvate carboxylase